MGEGCGEVVVGDVDAAGYAVAQPHLVQIEVRPCEVELLLQRYESFGLDFEHIAVNVGKAVGEADGRCWS